MTVKRFVCVCLALLLSMALPLSAAAETRSPIAAFRFDPTNAVAEGGLKDNGYGDKDTGYLATEGEARLFASVDGVEMRKLEWTKDLYETNGEPAMQPAMTGGAKHPWGEGAYLEVRVSTKGCAGIDFSAQLGATKKGPRDFTLQYSVDGEDYTDVASYSLTTNKYMENAFAVRLPADADDRETLYIRIAVAGETLVGGGEGLVGTTSGEVAVNNIVVSASKESGMAGLSLPVWLAIGAAVLVPTATVAVLAVRRKKA